MTKIKRKDAKAQRRKEVAGIRRYRIGRIASGRMGKIKNEIAFMRSHDSSDTCRASVMKLMVTVLS